MKTTVAKNVLLAVVAAVLMVGVGAQPALASGHTFDVSVYHGINGTSLGLSKDLPVDIYIYNGSGLLAYVPDFTFGERFDAELPAGEYEINVFSQELGIFLPSMAVGPVDIPGGVDVRMSAQLGAGKTPTINVKVNGNAFSPPKAKAESMIGEGAFAVSVYHGINGRTLGLSQELPVDIYIYNDLGLFAYVSDFTYGERFDAELPAGEYEINVYSQELDTFLPSMTVGPVDIPEGVEVRLNAQLISGLTPSVNVKIK